MKIKNRTADVSELRCHICQDFMKMLAVDDWRKILYPFIQNAVTGPYKDNYIEQYKTIRRKGIETYSIDDMDVPFIVNILRFGPKALTITTIANNTRNALNEIKADRHIKGHSAENESEEELYLQALISLKDLQNFLHTVDINETTIPDQKRSRFVQKYSKDIADLKLEIYNDCIETFQIKKDIQLILSSDDQDSTFLQIYQSYHDKSRLSEENKAQMSRFLLEASNAGIRSAHSHAATYFLFIQHDLDEATHRYEMMIEGIEELSIPDARELINFVNHAYMTGKKPTERMMRFVELVKNQGFNIEVTDNGIVWNKNK